MTNPWRVIIWRELNWAKSIVLNNLVTQLGPKVFIRLCLGFLSERLEMLLCKKHKTFVFFILLSVAVELQVMKIQVTLTCINNIYVKN